MEWGCLQVIRLQLLIWLSLYVIIHNCWGKLHFPKFPRTSLPFHLKPTVFIMLTSSSLGAPEVVTTSGASNDGKLASWQLSVFRVVICTHPSKSRYKSHARWLHNISLNRCLTHVHIKPDVTGPHPISLMYLLISTTLWSRRPHGSSRYLNIVWYGGDLKHNGTPMCQHSVAWR